MEILKPGRAQKGWAIEIKCTGHGNGNGGCGALLLVEESDLYGTLSSHYDGSTDYYTTFSCMACGVETDIADAKVPGKIQESAAKRTLKTAIRNRRLPEDTQGLVK